jgi:hypothetical protein
MKTKRIIILSLTIVCALFAGRAWGRYESNLRAVAAYESIPANLKEEFRGMKKEDFSRLMASIKEYGKNNSTELSLKELFEATTAVGIEIAQKKSGNEGVASYITEVKARFLTGYQSSSASYGDWKKLADKLALRLAEEKTEPNQSLQTTTMAVTDAAAQPPRQP